MHIEQSKKDSGDELKNESTKQLLNLTDAKNTNVLLKSIHIKEERPSIEIKIRKIETQT